MVSKKSFLDEVNHRPGSCLDSGSVKGVARTPGFVEARRRSGLAGHHEDLAGSAGRWPGCLGANPDVAVDQRLTPHGGSCRGRGIRKLGRRRSGEDTGLRRSSAAFGIAWYPKTRTTPFGRGHRASSTLGGVRDRPGATRIWREAQAGGPDALVRSGMSLWISGSRRAMVAA